MTSDTNASHREPTFCLCAHLVQRQTVLPALYHSEEGSTLLDQCYAWSFQQAPQPMNYPNMMTTAKVYLELYWSHLRLARCLDKLEVVSSADFCLLLQPCLQSKYLASLISFSWNYSLVPWVVPGRADGAFLCVLVHFPCQTPTICTLIIGGNIRSTISTTDRLIHC